MRLRILIALALAAQTSYAADWRMNCPPQLATTQSVSGQVTEGWSPIARTASAVHDAKAAATTEATPAVSVSVFDGPPSEMADLVPDDPNARVVRWTFDGKCTRDIYIVCNYADTRIALSRKAPAEITSCTLGMTMPGVVCR